MKTLQSETRPAKTKLKITYIILAATFTSTILLFYSWLLKGLIPASNLTREYCICFGQLFFQGILLFVFSAKKHQLTDYLFQMMMVSFTGAILLLPVLVSAFLFYPCGPGVYYYLAFFLMVVLYMFFDHKKRVKEIGAPFWLSYTWVLYRFIVLLIIT